MDSHLWVLNQLQVSINDHIFGWERETRVKKDQENQWYNMMVAEMEKKPGNKHYWSLRPD